MPVVCGICGSSNRSNAKFCSGCASRLPGFAPSGPAALDAPMAFRPPPRVQKREKNPPNPETSSVPLLPAETAGFWLKVGCLVVAMGIGFTAWFLYVTRKVTVPSLPAEVGAALTLESRPANPSVEPVLPAEPAPPVATAPSPGPAASPPAPPAAPAVAKTPPPASPPAPASARPPEKASAPEAPAKAEQPPAARRPTQTAGTRSTARPPAYSYTYPSYPRTEPTRDPSDAAVQRALSLARTQPDPGPPVAPGPGPLYERTPMPPRASNDSGPPIAPGPGPLYETSRPPVRAPSVASGDPGPPITVGPGPLVNYSTPGAGSR